MTPALLALVGGLALADSFNPATIVMVVLVLVSPLPRPVLTALVFTLGAALTVFTLGTVLFLSSSAAAGAVTGGLEWLRRLAFSLAAVTLAVAAYRRVSDRPRRAPRLPGWFSPWTALPLGVVVTGADLPNAFPYFIAIERLVNAGVTAGTALPVLAGYAVVYCVPCLVLLAVGVTMRTRLQPRLDALYARLGTGTIRRSVPAALGLLALALGAVAVGWL